MDGVSLAVPPLLLQSSFPLAETGRADWQTAAVTPNPEVYRRLPMERVMALRPDERKGNDLLPDY